MEGGVSGSWVELPTDTRVPRRDSVGRRSVWWRETSARMWAEDRWAHPLAQGHNGQVEGLDCARFQEALEADGPRRSVVEVVVEEFASGGDSGDVSIVVHLEDEVVESDRIAVGRGGALTLNGRCRRWNPPSVGVGDCWARDVLRLPADSRRALVVVGWSAKEK